ncbi:MAG: hypothetical protein KKA73_08560 [Chloroflexi bacterium]|nr:hypothetical protein [Chloroflexota bacterium]MBU1747728.1 hypothetical protein [Chloroflexota bacterium]MBU1880246.1 hypothetical protein [Chloroflexota bacterium]
MDSSLINKIQKARRYAEELDRVTFTSFRVEIQGDNDVHTVEYRSGQWLCDCDFFRKRGICSHTMTMERVLGPMLPIPQREQVLESAMAVG